MAAGGIGGVLAAAAWAWVVSKAALSSISDEFRQLSTVLMAI